MAFETTFMGLHKRKIVLVLTDKRYQPDMNVCDKHSTKDLIRDRDYICMRHAGGGVAVKFNNVS